MDSPKYLELKDIILDDPTKRFSEIYKIINLTTKKMYIGQCVSHILNHKRYRPYGYKGRFKSHISEAFSTKKHQSHYLNNAIRKYGISNFKVELIEYCNCEDADLKEIYFINHYNTLYPNGYNLKIGGNTFTHSDESKKRVSNGVVNYFKTKKFERFKSIDKIDDNIEKYIRKLRRNNIQYGWYVYINNIKADFGGVHISLEDSYNQAVEFIKKLKQNLIAKHLDAGNSLESLTTTS